MGLFDFVSGIFGGGNSDDRRMKARARVKRGTQILIIDDSTTVVTLLRRMLEQSGHEPLEAFDAESGIQMARQNLPRLIFLDIVLPGMNGFAALRTLRRDPLTAQIPVIMMSGNEQATEQFWAQKIGADDFMKKPFSRPESFCAGRSSTGGKQKLSLAQTESSLATDLAKGAPESQVQRVQKMQQSLPPWLRRAFSSRAFCADERLAGGRYRSIGSA